MKNIFRLTAVALLAATLFSACTGAFEDMNTNPKGVSDEELKQDNNYIGMHFIPMMQSIYYNKNAGVNVWEYQLIQNLNADLWSARRDIAITRQMVLIASKWAYVSISSLHLLVIFKLSTITFL